MDGLKGVQFWGSSSCGLCWDLPKLTIVQWNWCFANCSTVTVRMMANFQDQTREFAVSSLSRSRVLSICMEMHQRGDAKRHHLCVMEEWHMNPMFSIFLLPEHPHHIFVWWAKLFASVWVGKSPVGEQSKKPATNLLSLSLSKVNFILFISIIRILVQKLRCPDVGGNDQSQYRYLILHVAIEAKKVYVLFSVWSEVPRTFLILFEWKGISRFSSWISEFNLIFQISAYVCPAQNISFSFTSEWPVRPTFFVTKSKWRLQNVLHSTAKEEAVSL